MSIHMRGDVVDLHNSLLGTADHNVQALTQIEVALIPVEAIREVACRHPAVGLAMWHDTLVGGSIHREWTVNADAATPAPALPTCSASSGAGSRRPAWARYAITSCR